MSEKAVKDFGVGAPKRGGAPLDYALRDPRRGALQRVRERQLPMIEKLLKAGADPNAAGPEDETPLMTVARVGSVPAAKVLLAHGAKVDARESWHGETALMWAAAQKHPDMISALIAAGADVNALSTVVKWDRQTTAEPREKWLPLGGFSPLMFAAREGCVECAKVLVDSKASVNQADPDGITPMVNAIINGTIATTIAPTIPAT